MKSYCLPDTEVFLKTNWIPATLCDARLLGHLEKDLESVSNLLRLLIGEPKFEFTRLAVWLPRWCSGKPSACGFRRRIPGSETASSAILCTIAVILLSTFVDVGRGVRLAV